MYSHYLQSCHIELLVVHHMHSGSPLRDGLLEYLEEVSFICQVQTKTCLKSLLVAS